MSSSSTPHGTPTISKQGLKVSDEPSPRISGHGRPLSTIESVTSSASSDDDAEAGGETGGSDDDDDDDGDSIKGDQSGEPHPGSLRRSSTPPARPAKRPAHASVRRSSQDLRSQVLALFNRCVPASDGESDGEAVTAASKADKVVPVKALPRLLKEYETEMGMPLVEPELQPQLDQIIEQTPELPLGAEDLVGLIHALEAAREAETSGEQSDAVDAPSSPNKSQEAPGDSSMDSSLDDSMDSTTSSSDDDEEKRWAGASTPQRPRYPSTGRPEPFPRSLSEHADLTVVVEDEPSPSPSRGTRRKTTSDPSVSPFAAAKQRGSSGSEDKKDRSRERRVSGSAKDTSTGEEREVLKGKGRAKGPPSAWNRPRPQALARSRRVSDASSVVSQDQGEDGDSIGSAFGPRRRGVSGPLSPSASADSPVTLGQVPRSASGGFSFPRAMSPESGWMASEIDRWNQGSYDEGWEQQQQEVAIRPASSRGASPEVDEAGAGFHTFSAYANSTDVPKSASSVSGHRSRNSIGGNIVLGAGADQAEMQVKLEALRKLMADRDAKHEEVASQQETMISELQGEIEELKASLAQKRKEEKERNWRIQGDQDQIALMEAELNKVNAALEAARQQAANFKSDYEDQLTETERQRSRNTEMVRQLSASQEAETAFTEAEAQWAADRETYRETIRGLNERVAELEMLSAELEASRAEATVLAETIERLNAELEEARRGGSSFVVGDARGAKAAGANNSMPASVSRRLGSELARYFAEHGDDEELDAEEFEEELTEAIEAETGDASTDSIIETIIRRRRRTNGKKSSTGAASATYAEAGMQTSDVEAGAGTEASSSQSRGTDPEPPTYDEAALEKALSARLHPSCSEATTSGDASTSTLVPLPAGAEAQAYEMLKKHLGTRCTVLEELLEQAVAEAKKQRTDTVSVETTPAELKPSSLANRLGTAAAPWANKAISVLPTSAQTYLRIATEAVPSDDSSRLALLSALVFVLGLTAGGALFSPSRSAGALTKALLDSGALDLEDPVAWRVSNALGVGIVGPGLVEWGAALGGAQRNEVAQGGGWWGWLMLRGARAVGVVPT